MKAKIFGKVEATFENRAYSASSGAISKYYARGSTRRDSDSPATENRIGFRASEYRVETGLLHRIQFETRVGRKATLVRGYAHNQGALRKRIKVFSW